MYNPSGVLCTILQGCGVLEKVEGLLMYFSQANQPRTLQGQIVPL